MARYIDADETIELLKSLGSRDYRREKGTICDAIKMLQYPEYTPTVDVAPKIEVAMEIIAFVHQLIDMQPYEGRWITTSGEEIIADVGYFFSGFEIVEKEILKKYTEEKV